MPPPESDNENENLRTLVAQRGQIKGQLTRFTNYVDGFDNGNYVELELRLEKAEKTWKDFCTIESEIECLDDSENHIEYRENFEELYFAVVAKARKLIKDNNKPPTSPQVTQPTTPVGKISQNTEIKLPVISIPEFYGDYREWPGFFDTFSALVNNNESLTNVQKFHYLRDSLKGDSKQVIESLEISNENYTMAIELLKSRFDNKKLIKKAHVASLFNIPVLTKESYSDLRKFFDEFNKHVRALKNLGELVESWDCLLIHLINTKLDFISKREWEKFSSKLEDPKIDDIKNFLTERCNILETLEATNNLKISKYQIKKSSDQPRVYASTSFQTPQCALCNGSHFIYQCRNFLRLPIKSRYMEATKLKLCTNCLRPGHFKTECRSSACKYCQQKHSSFLHYNNYSKNDNDENTGTSEGTSQTRIITRSVNQNNSSVNRITQSPAPATDRDSTENTSVNTHCAIKQFGQVLLSTAIIFIKDSKNQRISCRALLDSGSQSNFMTYDLFEKLGHPSSDINLTISGIGHKITKITKKVDAIIESRYNAYNNKLSFQILDRITDNIPSFSFSTVKFNIPENITLADPSFNTAGCIDILLGAAVFYDLLCVGQLRLAEGQLILQKSKLGWLVAGSLNIYNSMHSMCNLSREQNLEDQLEKFWKVEECQLQHSKFSNEELLCESIFCDTTVRDKSGRFIVTLPMRGLIHDLGQSEENAIDRFLSLEGKFAKNHELKQNYAKFIKDYEDLGHMSKIPIEKVKTNKIVYYLPHHGVIKESSITTKLRVVFDASCKTTSNVSLNDILMIGPIIQEDLFSILLRFRKYNFVIISDVAKMYRQVLITESQRDLQRIIWRENSNESLKHYRLNTVTYGMSPASFLAIRCLHELAYLNKNCYPRASEAILHDFYVDDLITGANTIIEAKELKHDVEHILKQGGFQLRKWVSNDHEIINDTNKEHDISEYYFTNDKNVKTLGLLWNADKDIIQVSTHDNQSNQKVTKRTILSTIAQIFDPLGLVGPVIIVGKIMLQRLWKLKIAWDESVPLDIYTDWVKLRKQIHLLNILEIPRHVTCNDPIDIQLHGYSDASMVAYGACIFLRSTNSAGDTFSRLLCAKSRVAPLKTLTLPRLELCGAVLLAQLTQKVIKALNIKVNKVFLWCDSKIVIAWISSPSSKWKTFICNRVAEIQRLTNTEQWYHIASSDNPADIISRGLYPEDLVSNQLWWSGPSWLLKAIDFWPISQEIDMNDIPEAKITGLVAISNPSNENEIISRFSSLTKLQRVVAYCLRFKHNIKNKTSKLIGNLSIDELNNALLVLVKISQATEFADDLHNLKGNKPISKSSKLNSLNPFLDEVGIIRVGGRLIHSSISVDRKHPMVLSHKHHLTELIIVYEHVKNLHAGTQATLASIRQKFWPLRARSTVKKVLHKCVTCFRVNPRTVFPQMGNLPEDRLKPVRPFYTCGVDYAGPFYIKDGKTRNRKIIKCYLCLFVCFVTKACHLELVGDLSTEAFLNALKRFISRRGICKDIYSDNGRNFLGAKNELKDINKLLYQVHHDSKLSQFLIVNEIRWHFIPARAPHFGGLWEGAVKSAKFHLKRIVGNSNLTFEELSTVFIQIEAILNSRPLTPISEDPNDLIPLTPSHFLIGDVLTAVPQLDFTDANTNRLTKFHQLQQMVQHFWKRWSDEYLSSLQERNKWKFPNKDNIKVGAMVLLKTENTPPLLWPLGRITELHPGKDNVVRVVSVKTVGGVLKRCVTKICVLPIETDNSDRLIK